MSPCTGPKASISPPAWRAIVTTLGRPNGHRPACMSGQTRTPSDILRYMFGQAGRRGRTGADGQIEAEIRGHSEEMVARQLAGLGGRFEVLRARRPYAGTWPTSAGRWWTATARATAAPRSCSAGGG